MRIDEGDEKDLRNKFISLLLCMALMFQAGGTAWGEEIISVGEEQLFWEETGAAESDNDLITGQGMETLSKGSDLQEAGTLEDISNDELLVDDSLQDPAAVESSAGTEVFPETEVPSETEALPETEVPSETEALPETGIEEVLAEETLTNGADAEGLLEDPETEELQVVTITETVDLSDPTVVSDTIPAAAVRMFRMAQFNGCFGNQLTGSARELYDSRVDYYVTKRNTGAMVLSYTLDDSPYTFAAEIIQTQTGKGINTETEEYQAEQQQVLFDLQSSIDAFIYDHPEIFWLRGGKCIYKMSAVGSGSNWTGYVSELFYTPSLAFSGADFLVSAFDSAVTQTVNSLLSKADIDGNGCVEQLELIMTAHDYLCQRFYYDSSSYQNYESSGDYRIFCSAGGFLDSVGTGVVCEGYAKAFKVICDQWGIPCVLIGGTVTQNGKTEGHMWNGVQLNGKWYLMDVTWDDGSSGYSYKYFMVGNTLSGRVSSGYFGGVSFSTAFVYPQLETEALVYCLGMQHEQVTETVITPTCVAKGYTVYTCNHCGSVWQGKETAIDSNNHNYQKVVTAPTCTNQGNTTYTCSRCGFSYKTDVKAALGHNYSSGICTRCGGGDSIVNASVSSIGTQAYGAKALTPAVTVKFGSRVLRQGTDYTVTYRNNVNRGTAYATVTGIGIYRGTVSRSFTIGTRSVSSLTVSAIGDRVYTGKTQKPSVTLRNNGVKLVKDKDYTISYSKNKSIGQAVITIKGKGNYSGTRKIYFSIVPKAPTFSKLKSSSKGKLTAYWKRVSGAGGYQIQYSLNSSFGSVKSVTAGAGSSSKTISGLAKGKVYYVRVRCYKKVSGKKYYSAWSKVRKVTVKK